MGKCVISNWPLDPKCAGCKHAVGENCTEFANPAAKWRMGKCQSATHLTKATTVKKEKTAKAAKKAKGRGKK